MKHLKFFCVGFFISFIGALPLGYLNVIGFEIFKQNRTTALIMYLIGVVLVESIVIYITFIFAEKIVSNKKLVKIISLFSVFFFIFMAYLFRFQTMQSNPNQELNFLLSKSAPICIGFILSSLNFAQIPFWSSWNIYIVANKYVDFEKHSRNTYIFGAISGSFFGMLTIILALVWLSTNVKWVQKYLLHDFLPIFFLIMAAYQLFIFFKKNKNNTSY